MRSWRLHTSRPGARARRRVAALLVAIVAGMWADPALANTISPTTLPTPAQGSPYAQTVTTSGGATPYGYAVSAGALPTGLSLDGSNGQITGTPNTAGTFNFTIQSTDAASAIATQAYTLTVASFSLTIQPSTLPAATQNTAYSQSLSAVGGTAPYSFSISSGALPAGTSLTSGGLLSGTPTVPGFYSFTVQANDPFGNSGFRSYTLSVGTAGGLIISPSTLPNGTQGGAYTQTLTTSGGSGFNTFSVGSGSLPPGLSLGSSSGTISGTPSSGGTSNFTVNVIDNNGNTGSRSLALVVGSNSLTLSPATLSNGTVSVGYNRTVTASGGTGPYTYSLLSGSLPTGLSLDPSTGAITGTPTAAGTFNPTIRAVDSNGNFGSRAYTILIGSNSLALNPATLPNGTVGSGYSQTVTGSGGTAPYTYSLGSGSLPAGLSLNTSSGSITGTPTTAGTSNVTIGVADNAGNTGNRGYSITVALAPLTVAPSSLPPATQGVGYSRTLTTTGGVAPYTYAVTAGALPAGLTLNGSTGVIGGTPSVNGTFNFTVQSTDTTPNTGTRAYTLLVGTNSLIVMPATLPNGTQGTAYNQTVTASGGAGPYTYAVSSGALPAGLALNASSGAITGTPSGSGVSNFSVQATDSTGNIGSQGYSVNIGTVSLIVNPASLPAGTQGLAYSQTVGATGGTAPYTYALTSGALPAGLTLNASSGTISGTPTVSGSFPFTIQASDSTGNVGSRGYTLAIGSNSLAVNPASLPAGTQGTPYGPTVTATGGTAPYTYTVVTGALPAGLGLNASTGAITGTPTGGGASSFTVRATDAGGNIGSRAYTVSIGTNSLVINPASLSAATLNKAYSQTVTATGGAAPYVYSISAGAMPTGLAFNTVTGAITGAPTAVGTFAFTVFARDPNGNTGSRAYSVATARLDPSTDPEVQALIAAQFAAARRFAAAQTTNVGRHLESLHDDSGACSLNLGIDIQQLDPATGPLGAPPANRDAFPGSPADEIARRMPESTCQPNGTMFSFWANGTLEFGSSTPNAAAGSNRFSTGGVTGGVDARIASGTVVGFAVGYGMDKTDVTQSGTKTDGTSINAMLYGSYRIVDDWFVDGLLGYGLLTFDNTRFSSIDGTTLNGTRKGSSVFGSLALSRELKYGDWKVAPYVRGDFLAATLDQYAEGSASTSALTFGRADATSLNAALGLRGSYDLPTSWGTLTPMARVEYRHAFDDAVNQTMFYSDTPGTSYTYTLASAQRDFMLASVGLRARTGANTTVELEYGVSSNIGASSATPGTSVAQVTQSLRAAVRVGF